MCAVDRVGDVEAGLEVLQPALSCFRPVSEDDAAAASESDPSKALPDEAHCLRDVFNVFDDRAGECVIGFVFLHFQVEQGKESGTIQYLCVAAALPTRCGPPCRRCDTG